MSEIAEDPLPIESSFPVLSRSIKVRTMLGKKNLEIVFKKEYSN